MNKTTIVIALAAVVIIAAAVAVAFWNPQEPSEGITTTVTIDEGLTCTMNGVPVKDGQTVSVPLDDGIITLHVESKVAETFGYSGVWESGLVTKRSMNIIEQMVTSYDFVIDFDHVGYTGNMAVGYSNGDDVKPLTIDFTIDDNLTVMFGTQEIKNGDKVTFYKDTELSVTTKDGNRHYINHQGEWSNDCEYASDGGTELTESLIVYILDTFYFGDATGYEKILIVNGE